MAEGLLSKPAQVMPKDVTPPTSPSPGDDFFNAYYGFAPPVTPVQTQPIGGSGSSGSGWQVPVVAPNFQFPQGLLTQIAQSLAQPMNYGANFGRFQFSRGTPQPPTAPPGWGRAPAYGAPWGQQPGPSYPQGLLGGGQQQGAPLQSWVPPYNPANPGQYPQGLLSSGGGGSEKAASMQGQQTPQQQTPQQTQQAQSPGGYPSWGPTPPPPRGTPIQAGQTPAQTNWTPTPGQSLQQQMASYMNYINQPASSFMAGFNQQPNMQAQIQYIMGLPPTMQQQFMQDPNVINALGGQNWRQNFNAGYYNTPARS